MIKVSVIVPVYKVEHYIEKCVTSLLNQTLRDIEIILVDDGSPDNCPFICDQYAQKDSRVKVIHKQNSGLGLARNSGLDIAMGEYIAFLDSDDYVSENIYELLYTEAKRSNLDICFCDIINFDYKGRTNIYPRSYPATIYSGVAEIQKFASLQLAPDKSSEFLVGYPNMSWNGVYNGDIIRKNKIRFRSERDYVSEDVLFHFENLTHFSRIGWLETPLVYHYMSNLNSLTNTIKPQKIQAAINMISFVQSSAPTLYSKNSYMKAAVDSYTIKLIEDISNSIGMLVFNPLKRYDLLFQFLKGCYLLLDNQKELVANIHNNKQSCPLRLWSIGRLQIACYLYSLRSSKRRAKNMLKDIINHVIS